MIRARSVLLLSGLFAFVLGSAHACNWYEVTRIPCFNDSNCPQENRCSVDLSSGLSQGFCTASSGSGSEGTGVGPIDANADVTGGDGEIAVVMVDGIVVSANRGETLAEDQTFGVFPVLPGVTVEQLGSSEPNQIMSNEAGDFLITVENVPTDLLLTHPEHLDTYLALLPADHNVPEHGAFALMVPPDALECVYQDRHLGAKGSSVDKGTVLAIAFNDETGPMQPILGLTVTIMSDHHSAYLLPIGVGDDDSGDDDDDSGDDDDAGNGSGGDDSSDCGSSNIVPGTTMAEGKAGVIFFDVEVGEGTTAVSLGTPQDHACFAVKEAPVVAGAITIVPIYCEVS